MSKKSRKSISSSEFIQIFQEVNKKSYVEKTPTRASYDFTLALPFIEENGLDGHIYFRSFEKGLPMNSERRIYSSINNILIKNLTIKFDNHLEFSKQSDWAPASHAKWHFEECRIEPWSSLPVIHFPWRGDFRFYKNEFPPHDDRGEPSWLFAFEIGSWVLFQKNDFKNSSMQIVHSFSDKDSEHSYIQKLSWEGREAYIVRDDSYYEAMIRKNYQLPETVRVNIPDAYSGHTGLNNLSFLGNKGIDRLELRCNAASYIFRGINNINFLRFNELDSHSLDLSAEIYIGARERIDPHFHYPLHHRNLFTSIREFAAKKQDAWLLNAMDKQLDRIEYFLTKDQKVSFRAGMREWFEYWQDRILYAWRRWSSDFYRSWIRPLSMIVLGYFALNACPLFWIDSFTFSDWITFSLQPVSKIHLYTEKLETVCGDDYRCLSPSSKNWLGFIGLLQVIWIAIWGFSFSKSIKR